MPLPLGGDGWLHRRRAHGACTCVTWRTGSSMEIQIDPYVGEHMHHCNALFLYDQTLRAAFLPPWRSCVAVLLKGPLLFSLVLTAQYNTNNCGLSFLCSCDRASWAKREERIPTRCKNIDDLLSIPDVDYWLLSRHVSGIFMPIIRRKDHVLLHMGFCW